MNKKEIKWCDYRKVPILMVDGEQMVNSSGLSTYFFVTTSYMFVYGFSFFMKVLLKIISIDVWQILLIKCSKECILTLCPRMMKAASGVGMTYFQLTTSLTFIRNENSQNFFVVGGWTTIWCMSYHQIYTEVPLRLLNRLII